MSEEQVPDVEEIKARLGEEIPVVEEAAEVKSAKEAPDIAAELQRLGRQFGETMRTAWRSEERQKIEVEMREGFKSFAAEVEKAFQEAKESSVARKAKEEAAELKERAESGEVTYRARTGVAQGLKWLSDELAKLAGQFTAAEKEPGEESE